MTSTIILIGIMTIVNCVIFYKISTKYKRKSALLEQRLNHVTNLYIPMLTTMESNFIDKENYEGAIVCKKLIKAVKEAKYE